MKGLFAKPHYVWDSAAGVWRCAQEDLARLRWVLPFGVLARELKPAQARPRLRLVGGGR